MAVFVLNENKIKSAVKCSSLLSEKIAWAMKPFTDNTFTKEFLLNVAEIMSPEHKQALANFPIIRNIAAQHVENLAENFQDKLNYWSHFLLQ